MKDKSFSYYAFVNEKKSPGVAKKIKNTTKAASNIGLKSNFKIFDTNVFEVFYFLYSLAFDKSDIIMMRFSHSTAPIIFIIMLTKRIFGTKFIIDVPTPRATVLKENKINIKNPIIKNIKSAYSLTLGSWVLLPANTIVQYAEEGPWFKLGLDKKTIKMGNGILINKDIPLVQSHWPEKELKLIGVAQLASWHGYDKIINAIAATNNQNLSYRISFTIVGDGDERLALEKLVLKLNLQHQIIFTGMLTGKDLDNIFNNKHIGVGSLALYRKGLNEASSLKTREYIARGLPVIDAGLDPDFDRNSPYRLQVSNDDNLDDLISLLKYFDKQEKTSKTILRKYAEDNLTLEKKVKTIMQKTLYRKREWL